MAEYVTDNPPNISHPAEVKPTFRCLDCGVVYKEKRCLKDHMCKDAGARPFVCEVCKKDFARQDRLTRHRRIHTGERPYACGCCSETFARTERLKKHMKRIHGVSKLACRPCNQTFDRWADFQKHIASHPNCVGVNSGSAVIDVKQEPEMDRNFQGNYPAINNDVKVESLAFGGKTSACSFWCSVCGEGFLAEHLFQEHLKTHRNQFGMQTNAMNPFYHQNINMHMMNDGRGGIGHASNESLHALDFAVTQTLARRMTNGIDSGMLRCMRCGKTLPFAFLPQTYAEMDNYQQMNDFCTCHLVPEKEQQRFFENTYSSTSTWLPSPEEKKPKRLVSTDRRTCYECGELLSSVYALVRHIQSKHVNDRPYVCCECDKAFTRRDKLGRHFLKHPGVFEYACTECGVMFPRWIDCRQHMRLHRLSCNLCRYGGSQRSEAEPHVHANACNVCGAHFSRGYRLAEHLRKHTGEAPFSCGRCGRGFAKLEHKNAHEKLHTRESSLVCGTCNRSFETVELLLQHRRTHFVNNLTNQLNQTNQPGPSVSGSNAGFTCDTCLRQFKKKYALQRHQLSHTGERPFPCPNCGLAFTTSYGRKRHIESVHGGIMVQPTMGSVSV